MTIAILGAGFCGVAACWNLLQSNKFKITLFDPAGIAGGASGIAAGLLHPYAGLHAKLNWQGKEGLEATLELLKISENELGRQVADYNGILRPALTDSQIHDYKLCASRFEDVEWLEKDQIAERFPHFPASSALYIQSGITVDSSLYLDGLWKACVKKGAQLKQEAMSCLDQLQAFDFVITCLGAATKKFHETKHIPIGIVKGQILQLEWPTNSPPLPCSINSQVYITQLFDVCMAGSTFERNFIEDNSDWKLAENELMPKIGELYPPLANAKILQVKAGLRAVAPQHLPYLAKINDKLYCITGMGSKGLLYHALIAKKLAALLDFT